MNKNNWNNTKIATTIAMRTNPNPNHIKNSTKNNKFNPNPKA